MIKTSSARSVFAAMLTAAMTLCSGLHSAAQTETAVGHLRLIDRLDRPQDGYCLDILGVGRNLRLELPIFAHNCKSGLTPDSAVAMTDMGEIRFVAPNLCVTAFGVNGRALPGSPIVLRACGGSAPFFESAPLQRFEWTGDDRLRLVNSDLCLSAGSEAATTYSAADRWRTLTVEDCDTAPAARSVWEFVQLN